MLIIGALISILIGVVLGLVGGGGSILTVPLVHYLFGTSLLLATTYSLFVVAVASGIGTVRRTKLKQVDFRQGVIFVIPSMLTALVIRGLILPRIPSSYRVFSVDITLDSTIAGLLVLVMLFTAIRTLLSKRKPSDEPASFFIVGLFGVLTGLLSGLIGAGGGFIIVPILLRLGLEMRVAVGTSMFIISIQSVVALIGDVFNPHILENGGIDWMLLLMLTVLTVLGVLVGTYLQKLFSGNVLRKIFSFILIAVSLGIAYEKLFLN